MTAETTQIPEIPLTPEERLRRQKAVRKTVLLRGVLLGAILAAWWVFFVPESLVEPPLKYVLGIAVGLLATGSYLFNLRQTLWPQRYPSTSSDLKSGGGA